MTMIIDPSTTAGKNRISEANSGAEEEPGDEHSSDGGGRAGRLGDLDEQRHRGPTGQHDERHPGAEPPRPEGLDGGADPGE
jgi:hypothetical protein